MTSFATQPAQKHACQHGGIQPICLCALVLSRDSDAARMDDVYLNPLFGQPPCQPESVAPGLEGNGDAIDGATFANCLIAPAVQEAQERGFVRHDLFQGLSFDTWHGSGDGALPGEGPS